MRNGAPIRESAPWICIRQLESIDTTVRAPVRRIESILSRTMLPDTSSNFTKKCPQNRSTPGYVHLRSSRPRTFESSRRGPFLMPTRAARDSCRGK